MQAAWACPGDMDRQHVHVLAEIVINHRAPPQAFHKHHMDETNRFPPGHSAWLMYDSNAAMS